MNARQRAVAKTTAAYLLTERQAWLLLQTMIVKWAPHWHPDDIKALLKLGLVESRGDGLVVTRFGEAVRLYTTTIKETQHEA